MDTTLTTHNAVALADRINAAFVADPTTTVNGMQMKSRYGNPVARVYQNGTISISTPARTKKDGFNDQFIKVGTKLTIAAGI